MATRSSIAKLNLDGTVTSIYCHWDGSVRHNGMVLKDNYTDPNKIDQLINLGALSCLGIEIGEKQDFDSPTDENWCLVYGRDRGETDTGPYNYTSIQNWLENGRQEYNYLWTGEEWLVAHNTLTKRELRSLVQVILESKED